MFKLRVVLKIIGGVILINLIACDSLKKTLDIGNTNSLASSKPVTSSNISSDLMDLPNKTKSKLLSHISNITKSTLAA